MERLPREWLVGPTTCRAYNRRWLDSIVGEVPQRLLERSDRWCAEVEARLGPGEELWEWDKRGGDFSSAGGLAGVRDGEIVWWVRAWVS